MREITYGQGELVHPQVVDGRVLWTSLELQEFIHKLHYGDPVIGWEGDPRLALYLEGESWVLERLEADGEYRTVCRSRPGLPLDERLFIRLMQHDLRRGFDPTSLGEGQRPEAVQNEEAMLEALERAYWGAAKDLGL